ncbi:eukaryotic translation initiation factor 4G-like isoform X3 [Cynara cardunculus var. scolymus]|uniref:eukaryotic translation initiation factor 4G-like isoform X3 n=1 Tax=Cynara cardunculus var. scolymus TaxID=59895 RepID=UPI000D627CD6|nr:eukaryotic translation initiation factor 4G-like isoform X3 [Cynara cardunculus var. scolymus]
MSVNQSRGDKNEPSQNRRSGRSGNPASQRNFQGGGGKGGGGGSTNAPPSSSYYTGKSFKKVDSNAQGVQSRVTGPHPHPNVNLGSSNSSTLGIAVQNGAHIQPPLRGTPDAPFTGATLKPADASIQKSTPGLPKAPQSNATPPSYGTIGATGPVTPVKGSTDGSRPFPLQFGSISPSVMNVMQVPARTNSAPPNLDEQKRAQARLDSLKTSSFPNPAVPKQHLTRKDVGAIDQSNAGEAHPTPKEKRDLLGSTAPVSAHIQKPSGPPRPSVSRVSVQMPFHQSQLHLPFGGPNPPMQSQGMANTVPLPMHLPVANPPQVPQQVFVPGIPHHPMSSQGIIHQNQGMNFSSQMGPQLGNMGMGLGPQYPQQQMGNYGGTRRTVKITHPDTHEELRLDKRTEYVNGGSSGPRSHPHGLSQSQAIPSFPPASMNYYSNPYNASSLFIPLPGSNPLTNAQTTPGSQAPRFYNQVTVKPAISAHGEKVGDSSLAGSSPPMDKCEISEIQKAGGEGASTHPHKNPEPIAIKIATSSKPSVAAFGSLKSENLTDDSISSASPATVEDSTALVDSGSEVSNKASVNRSSSFKEEQTQPGKNAQSIPIDKLGGQSSSVISSSVGDHGSLHSGVHETSKSSTPFSGPDKDVLESSNKVVPSTNEGDRNSTEVIGFGTNSNNAPKVEGSVAEIVGSSEREKDSVDQNQHTTVPDVTAAGTEIGLDTKHLVLSEPASLVTPDAQQQEPVNNVDGNSSASIATSELDVLTAGTSSLNLGSSHGDKIPSSDNLDDHLSSYDCKIDHHADSIESVPLDEESHAVLVSVPVTLPLTLEVEGIMSNTTGLISPSSSGLLETSKGKGNIAKGKKLLKEILKNADARGTTSDLYMAYKRPEEKKETSSEIVGCSSDIPTKQASVDSSEKDVTSDEKRGHSKFEPDDWEDAADISTPKLETDEKRVRADLKHRSEDDNDGMTKKYSRDFLLKFSDHCTDLPEGFEITTDVAEAVIVSNVNAHREPFPSPGRGAPAAGPRLDRRSSNVGDDDKWNKLPGSLGAGRDMRPDMIYPGSAYAGGFRPHGGNFGVLKTPRGQTPSQYSGGILAGPIPSPGQAAMQRNNSDSDRWQRGTGYQKGLIPSPQTPMQVMHKAERKYEVGKITDEEHAKQRQLKGILNKLTPQNFEKLFEQVKEVNIDNAGTLSGVIDQIFDKALMEPTFVEMYANFCAGLAVELPDFSEENEKITFKRLLLNKCQEEFERGEREEQEANRTEEEGEVKQTEGQREEKRLKARRRMLGNIRLIGELYKKRMLTGRIMHECITKLLGQYQNPDEEDLEALCKLMSTIGEMIDHPKAKEHMDAYFDMMFKLSNNMKLSSRVRFMLKDAIDLRKNKWQQRRKVEGPKKIEEVHRDAAQERQAQSNRLARGSNSNQSLRRGQQMDFGPKGSSVLPSNSQTGGFRGLPQQLRGYGNQDSRFEERHSFESRTLSVSTRPVGDDSITLVPQGGLANRMSIRGQMPSHEMPNATDSRRIVANPNGYGSMPDRTGYGSRDDLGSRYVPERSAPRPIFDQSNIQEHNVNYVNRDMRNTGRVFERVPPSSPPTRGGGRVSTPPQLGSDKVLSEDRLHDMSIKAIREFYSANDEKEVALCIKDLNAPSFYPTMISIWIADSFERKDMERESLAKLLVNLTRSQDGIITQDSLIRGFESVLSTLEDAVNDAPKAPEFLGRIFSRMLLENVIPYKEAWRLIHEGGEEQGQLVEVGLAAEILGVILEIIKSEKGDVFLNNLRADSNLDVQSFRSPTTKRTSRLDKFI